MESDKAEQIKQEGNKLFKQGKYQEALEKYEEANKLNPSEITYYLNMAGCHHELKNYDKVIENCQYVVDNTFNFEKKLKLMVEWDLHTKKKTIGLMLFNVLKSHCLKRRIKELKKH